MSYDDFSQGGAAVARESHKLEVGGSSPSPASNSPAEVKPAGVVECDAGQRGGGVACAAPTTAAGF